ncbi:putative bifunctional diguanylate cyclase/phosphodiesterase [Neptunicella marina]|uniref:Bifunctional diguanylate cyclase/phosphodiesterase n=1 Tax=Neptunicella marina TaxID=2125989 RepID=A0A8J6IUS0_9ALTE|nr:bifunctional diguanylate cyclase/phosphodiesterase [Neptunicella marina]MBC3766579.1 bifunctional diguanylate cyclase/phosphodiesterase [Neptunicella marina]
MDVEVKRFFVTAKSVQMVVAKLLDLQLIYPVEQAFFSQRLNGLIGNNSLPEIQSFAGIKHDFLLFSPNSQQAQFTLIALTQNTTTDKLTQLMNRASLIEGINQWQQNLNVDEKVALFIVELDSFSKINDVLEHATGDLVLFHLARRLETFSLSPCKLARLHGDEFGLAVRGIVEQKQIWQVAAWLEKQFESPFVVDGRTLYLSAKIGISSLPSPVKDAAELIKSAYVALAQAEKQPVDICSFYTEQFAGKLSEQLLLESELNDAIRQKNQLEVYYQPKQSLTSGNIEGVEALIRWNHPVNGMVSPAAFIPVAEQSDLICDITDLVIEQVCQDLTVFRQHGYKHRISINISARDFMRSDFVDNVLAILKRHHILPQEIELEITEGAFISDFSQCCNALNKLREAGFQISIDDFGTGYSSLSYLRKLPVDVLKIDMSFVREIEQSDAVKQIFKSLIGIARALKLKVVAEGVDNPQQREVLTQIGCDLIQGYLLSKPLALDSFLQKWCS